MAFAPNSRDLAILYQYQKPGKGGKFVAGLHEKADVKEAVFKIVTFHRCYAKTKKYFYDSNQQETRDIHISCHERPIGFALGSNGKVAVSWKNPRRGNKMSIWLIYRDAKLMEACTYGQYHYNKFKKTSTIHLGLE